MRARILRFAEYPVIPWKNGLGVSREIVAGTSEEQQFGWRLSMADITTDAAFSEYRGIDRILAVVEGEIELRIEDAANQLRAGDPPVAFSGDVSASAKPVGEPAVDLNLMVSRESDFTGRIEPLTAGRYIVERDVVIVSLIDQLRVRAGAQYPLGRLDSVHIEGSGAVDVMGGPGRVIAYGAFVS